MFYDLTFTAAPSIREFGTLIKGLKDLTRPSDPMSHLLHVDCHSRSKYAASYYGPGAALIVYNPPTLTALLLLLPESHRNSVADIRCIVCRNQEDEDIDDEPLPEEAHQIETCLENTNCEGSLASRTRLGTSDHVTKDLGDYAALVRSARGSDIGIGVGV
ncbi:hypothetical protein CLAFUW4_12121 [Fulvia fulva]|uniref:Uncharacterized protein n=1 Tax=Passalora fulva TaxID=5499 RepID=A0A9Q8PER0_PASFU|nr:uncharacterized protein CLAFUR5_11160 [Fulvia fulva]KAK4618297.1 hypothetical protein CLAFUR4_12126 [Fulvia fulva]KAK4618695.1 hypothetical protein CLAFUR0_12137 [Fulvia fulva]UJO21105.1 hypothetical protein CLAFUR5_11160 [Fulvia fulva]WPV18245.1 hypothetical protein CLAFUW4_12121 [Fulvia fulva]WPV33344.1 hypothetical protein CLAFUW7_12128 [Fulvia fulva]